MTGNRLTGASLLYGLLAAGAFTWALVDRGTLNLYQHPDPFHRLPPALGLLVGGAAGVAFGLAVARMTRWTVRRYAWARGLHVEFQSLIGPLSDRDVLALAALSSVAEEAFFRGALQPTIGGIAAAAAFGLVHIPPGRRFIPWTLQAIAIGFALAGLFWLTGDLSAPIAAHFTVNYRNLHFINRYRP